MFTVDVQWFRILIYDQKFSKATVGFTIIWIIEIIFWYWNMDLEFTNLFVGIWLGFYEIITLFFFCHFPVPVRMELAFSTYDAT